MLALMELVILSVVVIPKFHVPNVLVGSNGIALIVADVMLYVTGWKAFRLPWYQHPQPLSLISIWRSAQARYNLVKTLVEEAQRASKAVAGASAVALLFISAILFVSGELTDISRNCYVLGDFHFHRLLAGTSALQFALLITFALVARTRTPASTAFLQLPLYGVLMAIIYHDRFKARDWINLAVCWALFLIRSLYERHDTQQITKAGLKTWKGYRRALFTIVLYLAFYLGAVLLEEYLRPGNVVLPPLEEPPFYVPVVDSEPKPLLLNSQFQDDYLGARLEPDVNLDWASLMSVCTDSETGLGVEDIASCLQFLSADQDKYMNVTENSKASSILSKFTKTGYKFQEKRNPVVSKMNKCNGQIFTYHTYWTGKATWRVELFIKAFLYTQNLSCSRLWIWLDTDMEPYALARMQYRDVHFERFHGLMKEGYISLKAWKIPHKIPLPRIEDNSASASPLTPVAKSEWEQEVGTEKVIEDGFGDLWLILDHIYKEISTPTQISDLVRFVVLHMHGGVYLDMDILLLRDLRPLLIPNPGSPHPDIQPAWAEQWVEKAENPGDYNTAVLSLPANSTISSYLLRGGRRMGMNYHPRVLGLMLWKDGRRNELAMLHNAIFDPLVTNLRREKTKICTVPCHKNFESAFMGEVEEPENEWSNYHGSPNDLGSGGDLELSSSNISSYAPPNRTMANFFHGAFAYHIHNQWKKFPENGSWMDVITQAQDGFFDGTRTNAYGEIWGGPYLDCYDRSEWTRLR